MSRLDAMMASNQWATRPDDQRFWDIPELAAVMRNHAQNTNVVNLDLKDLRLETSTVAGKEVMVARVPGEQKPVQMDYWPLDQLCKATYTPVGFLRTLPAEKAADIMNYRIKQLAELPTGKEDDEDEDEIYRPSQIMVRGDYDGLHAVGLTSQRYGRIWNYRIAEALGSLGGGWKVPPARPVSGKVESDSLLDGDNPMWDPQIVRDWTSRQLLSRPRQRRASQRDIEGINPGGLGIPVKRGDVIAPAGLYGTYSEMFTLMVDPSKRIEEGGLARGFILKNSEVGNGSFILWAFYLEACCGNHILLGLKEMLQVRIIHLGDKAEFRAFDQMGKKLEIYADKSVVDDQKLFERALHMMLGTKREEVVDTVFKTGIMSKRFAGTAYDAAVEARETGMMKFDPNSVRGMVFGTTLASQREVKWVDSRVTHDQAAGKLLQLASA